MRSCRSDTGWRCSRRRALVLDAFSWTGARPSSPGSIFVHRRGRRPTSRCLFRSLRYRLRGHEGWVRLSACGLGL